MLTQNYHAVYQLQDDQGSGSSASEESVRICQKELSSITHVALEICITIEIRNIESGIPIHVPLSCLQFLWEYNTIPLLCSEVKVKTLRYQYD